MTNVLVVEDTPSQRMLCEAILRRAGCQVRGAGSMEEALRLFRQQPSDLVLLDLVLPDGHGLDVMRQCLQHQPRTRVIVLTAHGSVSIAVQAMRDGAFDFLLKPFDHQRLVDAVANAERAVEVPADAVGDRQARLYRLAGLVGGPAEMNEIRAMVRLVARSMATVFLTGEEGAGKRFCARAIHSASGRSGGPFVPFDCAAVSPEVAEAGLFGRLEDPGSTPGGAIAAADGGTLFLDGLCRLDLALQARLLRFLETSTVRPAGSARPYQVNLRLICATSRDPVTEMHEGRLRRDLYHHLHVIPIHLPPLRERGEAVVEIAEAVLGEIARDEGKHFTGLSTAARALVAGSPWPGNMRQLVGVIRHAVARHEGPLVEATMLPLDADGAPTLSGVAGTGGRAAAGAVDALAGLTLAEIERIAIEAAIGRHGGSVPQAALELDVAPSTIYRKRDAWARRGARKAACIAKRPAEP